jgi:hypothetical protein
MGGAAVHSLARAGIGTLAITDPDRFEATNLNRQTFANVDTLGAPKVEVTSAALRRMNPCLAVEVVGDDWLARLDDLLTRHPVVVNAMDDVRAGISLYRRARELGATVVDAYTSPCPSVTVVRAGDPMPEERFGFPTVGVPIEEISAELVRGAFQAEVAYVARASTSLEHFEPRVAHEILAGRRPRSSFAPVVMIAGTLMAFEVIRCILGRDSCAGYRGYFFDPWAGRVEAPGA